MARSEGTVTSQHQPAQPWLSLLLPRSPSHLSLLCVCENHRGCDKRGPSEAPATPRPQLLCISGEKQRRGLLRERLVQIALSLSCTMGAGRGIPRPSWLQPPGPAAAMTGRRTEPRSSGTEGAPPSSPQVSSPPALPPSPAPLLTPGGRTGSTSGPRTCLLGHLAAGLRGQTHNDRPCAADRPLLLGLSPPPRHSRWTSAPGPRLPLRGQLVPADCPGCRFGVTALLAPGAQRNSFLKETLQSQQWCKLSGSISGRTDHTPCSQAHLLEERRGLWSPV